jgi:hypothetical protein
MFMAERGDASRRHLLKSLGVAAVASTAGCGGESQDETEPNATDEPNQTESDDSREEEPETSTTTTVVFSDGEIQQDTESAPTPTSEDVHFDGGSSESFREAVYAASEASDAVLEIAPGTYRISPIRSQSEAGGTWWAIRIPEGDGVTIEGNNATIIFTEPRAAGIYFNYGADITVRNLTVDYDPVPFTQGDVVDISDDRREIEIRLDEGYPSLTHRMFDAFDQPGGSIHTPDGEFISGTRQEGVLDKYYSEIDQVGDRRFRLKLAERCSTAGLGPDRKLLIKARRSKPAFYFYSIDNPSVSNVTVHASNGGGFLMDVCDTPSVRDCVIAPPEDSDRLIGIDSDGVRFVNDVGPPTLENCRIEYTGDDPIVVQHSMSTISEVVDERTVRVTQWHPFVVGPNDTLRGMTQTGVRLGDLPPIDSIDFRYDLPERGKPETITFTEPIDEVLSETDLIKNAATASRDFVIRNNTVRNVRGRLARIAAPGGVVEDNTFEGCHSYGIEIECDTDDVAYQPKGGVSDVTVRNNVIKRPGLNYLAGSSPAGVGIHHLPRDGVSTEGRPNRNIVVENNRIENGAHFGVEVEHAENIDIRDNDIADVNRLAYPGEPKYGVRLRSVESASVTGNRVSGSEESLDVFGGVFDSEGVDASANTVDYGDGEQGATVETRRSVTFSFDRTSGSGGYDTVGFRCYRLTVLDEDGESVLQVTPGEREDGIAYGTGVDTPEETDSGSWRWFGKEGLLARIYLTAAQVERGDRIVVEAVCPEPHIRAQLSVDGTVTDETELAANSRQEYTFTMT